MIIFKIPKEKVIISGRRLFRCKFSLRRNHRGCEKYSEWRCLVFRAYYKPRIKLSSLNQQQFPGCLFLHEEMSDTCMILDTVKNRVNVIRTNLMDDGLLNRFSQAAKGNVLCRFWVTRGLWLLFHYFVLLMFNCPLFREAFPFKNFIKTSSF